MPEDLRAELEEDLLWRQEEIAFLKNQLNNISDDNQKDRYRKSLVMMLYSHFEGYTKISLQTYIKFLNELEILCSDVNSKLIASTLNDEFNAYDNLDKKNQYFKTELPRDEKLHRFCRRTDLISEMNGFLEKVVYLKDSTINTESNLRSIVLKKNLYRLGLPLDLFEEYSKDIDALVNRRNAIAHGDSRSGIRESEYSNWENKIYRVMTGMSAILYEYALHEKYLADSKLIGD